MAGTQDLVEDPRNATVLVWVNGELRRRAEATVSVFDGGYIAGDGVWEGLRLVRGRWLQLEKHLDRLFAGAAMIQLIVPGGREAVVSALEATRQANGMEDGAHARLMVTRGLKTTPGADPRMVTGGATMVITMEHKVPPPALGSAGLALMTSTYRVTRPDQFDMRLNTHSRMPYILALQQAYNNGADEALMLDDDGHVASCNSTNFFFVVNGVVMTSTGENCFNGITRETVIELCGAETIPLKLGNFSLLHVMGAEEAFVTGTAPGIAAVRSIDGRVLGAVPGPLTQRITAAYRERVGMGA
ncbi:MAG: aminotransferase class IV [Janthinobacterium lividum]